jgi:hypothetical protein
LAGLLAARGLADPVPSFMTSLMDSQRCPPDSGTDDAFMGLSQSHAADMAAEKIAASP